MPNLNEPYTPEVEKQGKGHPTEPQTEVRDQKNAIDSFWLGDPDPLNGVADLEKIKGVEPTDAVTPASANPRRGDALKVDPDNDGVDAFDGDASPDGKALPPAPQHAILKHPTDYVDPEQGDGAAAGVWVNSRSLRVAKTPTEGRNRIAELRYDPIEAVQSEPVGKRSPARRNTRAANSALDVPEPEAQPRETEGQVFTYDELESADEIGAPQDPAVTGVEEGEGGLDSDASLGHPHETPQEEAPLHEDDAVVNRPQDGDK